MTKLKIAIDQFINQLSFTTKNIHQEVPISFKKSSYQHVFKLYTTFSICISNKLIDDRDLLWKNDIVKRKLR